MIQFQKLTPFQCGYISNLKYSLAHLFLFIFNFQPSWHMPTSIPSFSPLFHLSPTSNQSHQMQVQPFNFSFPSNKNLIHLYIFVSSFLYKVAYLGNLLLLIFFTEHFMLEIPPHQFIISSSFFFFNSCVVLCDYPTTYVTSLLIDILAIFYSLVTINHAAVNYFESILFCCCI